MRSAASVFVLSFLSIFPAATLDAADTLRQRHFEFSYSSRVFDVPADARTVDLWIPIPRSDDSQTVRIIEESIPPGASIHVESTYGNRMLHRRVTAPFSPEDLASTLRFEIFRSEIVKAGAKALAPTRRAPSPAEMERYLKPNAMVPLEGPLARIAGELALSPADPLKTGKSIYDYVVATMAYDKSKPGWGRGDVLWACDSQTGNCSDFHSVFIGLARTQAIPALFEIGFPLPPERGRGEIAGYHCWAWFHVPEIGWIPVDASEADKHPELENYYFGALSADRVSFSRGRDLQLVPPQQGPPLNFFVYPYVEVDGRPHEKVEKLFAYQDLK